MEIPLVLRPSRAGGALVYSIPLWYRLVMAFLAALIVAAFAVEGSPPGLVAWIVFAVIALAGLYEERWTFDPKGGGIVNRAGLVVAAKSRVLRVEEVERFRLLPFVRGTVPGSEDERRENAAALAGGRADDAIQRRVSYKKPFLNLVCETSDGSVYLINALPARRGPALRDVGRRIASLCGKPFVEG
jgi:hypothetical protein